MAGSIFYNCLKFFFLPENRGKKPHLYLALVLSSFFERVRTTYIAAGDLPPLLSLPLGPNLYKGLYIDPI